MHACTSRPRLSGDLTDFAFGGLPARFTLQPLLMLLVYKGYKGNYVEVDADDIAQLHTGVAQLGVRVNLIDF
jgi:hypothetical protein